MNLDVRLLAVELVVIPLGDHLRELACLEEHPEAARFLPSLREPQLLSCARLFDNSIRIQNLL